MKTGGGLTEAAFDAHIQFLINGWKVMKANNQDVSIAVLAYGKKYAPAQPPALLRSLRSCSHDTISRTKPSGRGNNPPPLEIPTSRRGTSSTI
jgi:hypothetical protein